jgi:hypothetical protein
MKRVYELDVHNLTEALEKNIKAKFDELVKSRKIPFSVIPAKAGIQSFQVATEHLDSGFHRSDDFLRVHQISNFNVS